MLTLYCLLTLAQSLPPNPQALPPSPERMILIAGEPKRSPEYRRAERKAAALSNQVWEPILRNRVPTTRAERSLILAVGKAAIPEAFLSDGAERKTLLNAVQKMRAGVSATVLKAIGELDLPETPRER